MDFPFYIFAWIACVAYASKTLLGKLTAKYGIANPWMFNFIWNLFILLGITTAALYYNVGIPEHWGNIILASGLYALAGILFILTLYRLDISVLSPLYSIRNALAVLFGALLVYEVLSPYQYALIGIIFVFGIFASIDEKWSIKSFFTKGILLAIMLMVVLALEGVFIKKQWLKQASGTQHFGLLF